MKKILYFVGGVPTEAELTDADAHYAIIRNGAAWHERDCFEECDLVMGKPENVPPPYRHLMKVEAVQQVVPDNDIPDEDMPVARSRRGARQGVPEK